jgi:hypothetical protein
VNTSLTILSMPGNAIGDEGAAALATALEKNITLRDIYLESNGIGNEGAAALAVSLQVNTSLTSIGLYSNAIDDAKRNSVNALAARNKRFRKMFLFDARRMLLSLMCADECGVVWPYLLGRGCTDGIDAPNDVESIRAEFLSDVVAERRRRADATPVEAKR